MGRHVWTAALLVAFAVVSPLAQGATPSCSASRKGSLNFKSGQLSLDFHNDNEPRTLSAEFAVSGCEINSARGLAAHVTPASPDREIPQAAIAKPVFLAKGELIHVEFAIDPAKLKAAKYSGTLYVFGEIVHAVSVKAAVTRSYPKKALPLSAVALGWLVGLGVAAFGIVSVQSSGGWNVHWMYVLVAVALAAYLAVRVYISDYSDALVWQPTLGNFWSLATNAGTKAAGASVVALMVKGIVAKTTGSG